MSNFDRTAVKILRAVSFTVIIMKVTKKIKCILTVGALLISACVTAAAVHAYDGTSDPVISLSYLKQYIQTMINPQLNTMQARIDALELELESLRGEDTSANPSDFSLEQYTVLHVMQGTVVNASAACDIMLRAGEAEAVVPESAQGNLSDYTVGNEIEDGQSIPLNHMILIARGDGRGVRVVSAEAYIMIRGEYTIDEP